jgi:predicted lipid-binding transport protein (Tim44 family)
MKSILASLVLAVFALSSLGYMSDADAKKRFGGGKSSGMQRESVQRDPTPPAAKPAAPAAAPQAGAPAGAPAAAAAPAAASGMSKWAGPIMGLAAGGLLAALFMGGAFDGIKFFDILLIIGFAFAAFMLFRMFMRKKAEQLAGASANGAPMNAPMQYSGNTRDYSATPASAPAPTQAPAASGGRIVAPEIGSALSTANASPEVIAQATASPRIPADFDVAPFERNSKAAFIRLQAANDAKDLNDIRDFTTPEMYGEIALQIQERGDATQRTEVVSVNARVIEVVIEAQRAVASVRYTGVIREDNEPAEGFDEVWHVVKDLSREDSTWKLAGIQQLQ